MRKIKTIKKDNRTIVIYYNGQPYAKIIPKRQRRKISDETKVVIGMIVFIAMVIGGGFFFEDTTAVKKAEAKEIPKAIVIEKIVKVKDDSIPPILKKIFDCESGGKHYDKNGKVIRGKVDRDDTGIAQINLRYHGVEAKRLGYDLMTEKGNIGYAKYLLENFGTKFWSASAKCWINK